MAGGAPAAACIALMLCFCAINVQGASASRLHLRGRRRLQAAVVDGEPRVLFNGVEFPVCTSLKQPGGRWLYGDDAAMLAWDYIQESKGNRNANSAAYNFDFCSGSVSWNKVPCFAGDGLIHQDKTAFTSISCATKPTCKTDAQGRTVCVGRK